VALASPAMGSGWSFSDCDARSYSLISSISAHSRFDEVLIVRRR